MFLLLAQELNFGRAAKKAYLSQQGLSDHIKRLEEGYGTALFTRKPTVALTEAGKAVYETLLNVRYLEHTLEEELNEIENGASGTLRIGLNYTRARILMPSFFAKCRESFPRVRLELTMEETRVMQDLLAQGKLDCFLGVNAQGAKQTKLEPIAKEGIYCMASGAYLNEYKVKPAKIHGFISKPVRINAFDGLPFVLNSPTSTAYSLIMNHMEASNVSVMSLLSVSDYSILERICRSGHAASFCPGFFVPEILSGNESAREDERLFLLPVKGLENALRFDLVYNGNVRLPKYMTECFNFMKNTVAQYLLSSEYRES